MVVTITIDLTKPSVAGATEDADTDGEAAADADAEADTEELAALAERAAAFVDALGAGPRLISPLNVAYTDGKLTVSALAYFRAEGS
jgi:hypothetical protein